MAALLRSARFLKFSPSGLLQITGTKRNGPSLGRLYSGALDGSRTGVCLRQISPAAENVSSRVWLYTAGCVRNYTVATKQGDEPTALQFKQAKEFDWALTKLDNSVKRTGRITKTLLLHVFHDICRTGYPGSNHALLLLRSCGSLLPEVPLLERTELAHHMWDKLRQLGARYDMTHYNALLKVYLQNEFKFSPTDFLAKMEAANIQPNRVTYQRLIAAYCQNGNIEGATTILGFMKSKDLPVTEAVFNSLLTGHARAGDIKSAKNMLTVMAATGIEPGPDTYASLLNAYAEKGDLDGLRTTLVAAESADSSLMNRDIMQVIFTLAKAGHHQHIPEVMERLRQEKTYVPDAINMCLSLITQGHGDTAFQILKTFPSLEPDYLNLDNPTLGNFFIRHCVNVGMPVEKIGLYCKELQQSNLHTSPLNFTLYCALDAKNIGMSVELMKIMKAQGFPVRPHYFWPLLWHVKDTAGVIEVLKGMQELDVSPDVGTLSKYVFSVFPSDEAAQQALKDAGVSLDLDYFLASKVRGVALKDLAQLFTMLSDPSFPPIEFSLFRSSLILSFRKCDDVESMAKVTELLYKDERFNQGDSKPSENASHLLYSLIASMTEEEVKAHEEKLRGYFKQLRSRNVTISVHAFWGIRKLLRSYRTTALIKDVTTLTTEYQEPADLEPANLEFADAPVKNVNTLETKLAELISEDKPYSAVLGQLIQCLCAEDNLQRALELKQQHEDKMTVTSCSSLITLCCNHDNVEEALNLKREISRKDSTFVLATNKYISLVTVLVKHGKVDEALDILKEMKKKSVVTHDTHVNTIFHMFNNLAAKGCISSIQRLQDAIFTLRLAKPTASLCRPLITAYLNRNDLPGALQATMECQRRYRNMPRIHDIALSLVMNGDTELLQKALDFVSQNRGEMNMLYDLLFVFLEMGRYREARKIIETPGLRAKPGRLQWYAEKCISTNKMEPLEQMVDMTAHLFGCDRNEMYCYILRVCKETNDWKKAEAVWMKLQEENVVPREKTLRLLGDILKNNGQEVPFEMPKVWYTDDIEPVKAGDNKKQARLMAHCKKGKAKEAYKIIKDENKKGKVFSLTAYDKVIRALLAEGFLEDAMAVKNMALSHVPHFQLSDVATSLLIITQSKKGQTKEAFAKLKSMLSADRVPLKVTVSSLVQALGRDGDVAGIQELQSLTTDLKLSSMIFVNNMALAHIKNGDLDSAMEVFESVFDSPGHMNPSIAFGIRKIMAEGNDNAIDKLSAMAERIANRFACHRPASEIFLVHLEKDKVEDAKAMLTRFSTVDEQVLLVSNLARKNHSPKQVKKITALLEQIPDFNEKNLVNLYLMRSYFLAQDLPSAVALYEQMQKEGRVVHELSLKWLADLYHDKGKDVPFTEPPEPFEFYVEKLYEKVRKPKTTAEE